MNIRHQNKKLSKLKNKLIKCTPIQKLAKVTERTEKNFTIHEFEH